MELKTVEILSESGIEAEKILRTAIEAIYLNKLALEAVASDPAINKLGLYNIDTANFRMNLAEASLAVEQAHARLCENHKAYNAIAEKMDIVNPGLRDGGGR